MLGASHLLLRGCAHVPVSNSCTNRRGKRASPSNAAALRRRVDNAASSRVVVKEEVDLEEEAHADAAMANPAPSRDADPAEEDQSRKDAAAAIADPAIQTPTEVDPSSFAGDLEGSETAGAALHNEVPLPKTGVWHETSRRYPFSGS